RRAPLDAAVDPERARADRHHLSRVRRALLRVSDRPPRPPCPLGYDVPARPFARRDRARELGTLPAFAVIRRSQLVLLLCALGAAFVALVVLVRTPGAGMFFRDGLLPPPGPPSRPW